MKILIDNGHGVNTPGKRSPDGKFLEYKYAREIATGVVEQLKKLGYDAERIVTEETDISLKERVNRVNKICNKLGSKNVIFISIHSNAAGNCSSWMNARGWSGYISKNASSNSLKLEQCFYKQAINKKIQGNRSVPKDYAWRENFYVLKNTKCPAVLTENLFYDNKEDLEYLLSNKQEIIDLHVKGIIEYINSF